MFSAVSMMLASWFFILLVILVVAGVAALFSSLRGTTEQRSEHGSVFGTVLLVGALGLGALMFYGVRQSARPVVQSSTARVTSTSIAPDGTRTVTVLDGDTPTIIDARGETKSDIKPPADKPKNPTAEAEPGSSESISTDDPPAWTNEPPHRDGDAYIIAVSSGDVSDPTLRDEALDLKLVAAANRYVNDILFKQPGVAERLNVSPQELREKFVRAQYPSPGKAAASDRLYARLELDADFRAEMEARQRRVISHDRLQITGGIAAGVLVALAGAMTWLKRQPLAA